VDSAEHDRRLPLEAQLRLRQVELQLEKLNEDQLRQCALAAWDGWLSERHRVKSSLEFAGIDLQVRATGYTPFEICKIHG
jgi:hypothetical protein